MMMLIDGECEKCGGHISSLDGGPPRCHECGWVWNREDWESEMEQVSKFIDKLIDDRRKDKINGPMGHKDPPGPKGPWTLCPQCGSYWSDWDPDTDTCTCQECGYTE